VDNDEVTQALIAKGWLRAEPDQVIYEAPQRPVTDGTIEEVKAYVEAHRDEVQAVLDAERGGKQRSTLLSWLVDRIESIT
jgi:hypothetical protein